MQCHTTMRNFIFSGIPNKILLLWNFYFSQRSKKKKEKEKNSEILMDYKRPQVTKLILTNQEKKSLTQKHQIS